MSTNTLTCEHCGGVLTDCGPIGLECLNKGCPGDAIAKAWANAMILKSQIKDAIALLEKNGYTVQASILAPGALKDRKVLQTIAADIKEGFGNHLTTTQILAIYDSFNEGLLKYAAATITNENG